MYANVHSHVVEHRCVYVHFLILHVRRGAKKKNNSKIKYILIKNEFNHAYIYHQSLFTHARQKIKILNSSTNFNIKVFLFLFSTFKESSTTKHLFYLSFKNHYRAKGTKQMKKSDLEMEANIMQFITCR